MYTDEQRIKRLTGLLLRYILKTYSTTDQDKLEEIEQTLPEGKIWLEQLDSLQLLREDARHYAEISSVESAWLRLEQDMQRYKRRNRRLWFYASAAAIVAVIWGSVVFFSSSVEQPGIKISEGNVHDRALVSLILSDAEDSLALSINQPIDLCLPYLRNENNTLIYDSILPRENENVWHTLKVGKGGEYRLTLSDGTTVWLNAESSLRYPVKFSGEHRVVELQGEGFFRVSPDQHRPFEVKTGGFVVNVLGTTFNVMNYTDEPCAQITLVSGKVCVKQGEREVVLSPDQQALVLPEGLSVRNVEARYYTSWIENFFLFDEEPLEMIVRKLARWYNLEFHFKDKELETTRFTGAIPKYENISKAFELLEMTTSVHFSINLQTITIMKKK